MNFVAIIGLVVAVLSLPAVWIAWRVNRSTTKAEEFNAAREYVQTHQPELQSLAWSSSPPSWKSEDVPLLAGQGWVLRGPRPLSCIALKLRENEDRPQDIRARFADMDRSYSKALTALPGSEEMFNGIVYRPLLVETRKGGLRITCAKGCYFDYLDNGEVLAHEMGARLLKNSSNPAAGPRRKAIADPFDLASRPTSLGINTLTIRKGADGSHGFYMHKRSGSYVVNEADQIGVVPAGEFTPSDVSYEALRADFSIWRNIMREYAEEFLGVAESYGRGGKTLDYENAAPYAELSAAYQRGDLIVWTFGLAIEPLCLKPELLTVCVVNANIFDVIFADMVTENGEGVLLVGPNRHGIPFTSQNVKLYADNLGTASAAAACLKLAWRYRKQLGLV